MSEITAVSLFTGAGGMDIGFEHAGVRILCANELNRDACDTKLYPKMKREEKPHSRFGRARQSMNAAPQSGRKGRSASGGVDGTACTAGQCRLRRSMLISRSMRT